MLLHWINSYLTLEGQLLKKADDSNYANTQLISLIHNAIPHMFSNVKLTVGNKLAENVNRIGHVSSLMYDVLCPLSKGMYNASKDVHMSLCSLCTTQTYPHVFHLRFKVRDIVATNSENGPNSSTEFFHF